MKIMKLLAACAMVGALATTTAMAEEFLVRDEFGAVVYDATNNAVTINLDAADIKDYVDVNNITGDLTVLVTNVATGTVSNTQIFQIDQGTRTALDNDGNDGTSTCVLKLSAAVKADYDAIMNPNAGTETVAEGEESTKPASSTYYVRLGGAEKGYIEDTFKFNAPVDNNKVEVTVDNTTANAFGTTGSSAVIVTAKSAIPAGKAVAYDGTPMYYTEYTVNGATVTKYVALCASFDATKIALVNGANTKIAYGNLVGDNDYTINGADLNQMINIVLDNAMANEAKLKLVADVNADGSMNGADLNVLINMVLDAAVIPPAATK